MDLPNDFKELLKLFNKHKVECLIANKRATGRAKDAAGCSRIVVTVSLAVLRLPVGGNYRDLLCGRDMHFDYGVGSPPHRAE